MIVYLYGVGGVWGFAGHFFLADRVVESIGWATGSGFQTELAFYHLGVAVAALLGIWLRDHLWTAVVLAKSIFLYGASYAHLRDIALEANLAPGNAGVGVLLGNFLAPTAMLILLALRLGRERRPARAPVAASGPPASTG